MADSHGRASFRRSLTDALATADLRRLQLNWTAAAVARTDAVVFALDRDAFLTAVNGHRYSAREADTLAAERVEQRPAARAV